MLIGVAFEVENKYSNYLKRIFASIDMSAYYWEIVSDQILYEENGKTEQGLFNACINEEVEKSSQFEPNIDKHTKESVYNKGVFIDGKSFANAIERDSYYFIFSDLKAYSNKKKWGNIETYEDFIDSYCEMIFLCVDSMFIEIYCKDERILQIIYDNCKKNNFNSIKYLVDSEAKQKSLIAF